MNGLDPPRIKQDAFGQRRFARIDVSRDADVASLDVFFGGEMTAGLEEVGGGERKGALVWSVGADGILLWLELGELAEEGCRCHGWPYRR